MLAYTRTRSISTTPTPPTPPLVHLLLLPPLLPFHLRIDYARLSIFFLHRTASKLFFLSAPSPTHGPLRRSALLPPYPNPSPQSHRRFSRPLPTRPRSKIVVSFLHPLFARPAPSPPRNSQPVHARAFARCARSPCPVPDRLRPCLPISNR